jgi:thioredoxin type arsenate reductase
MTVNNPSSAQMPAFLKLLSSEARWAILTILSKSDLRVHEIVTQVNQPQNLVSYHLQQLRDLDLIRETRSIADGREVYYSLNLTRLHKLYVAAGLALHPALVTGDIPEIQAAPESSPGPLRVLFLCTHNSARSQMAEGILRKRGAEKFIVVSAGSQPSTVHPLAIRAMADMGIDISQQDSKSQMDYLEEHFDYVITVCDNARENCPIFPGSPNQIHWSFPDPAVVPGTEAERLKAFKETALQLNTRIGYFLMLQRQPE